VTFSKQEKFWKNTFGTQYVDRNNSKALLDSNIIFFKNILSNISEITSCIEFGSNIGLNLLALKSLNPNLQPFGVEINARACAEMEKLGLPHINNSFLNDSDFGMFDLTLSKGVLIHINPELLDVAYSKLYNSSKKYILLCEYYNQVPVSIQYRGHDGVLFKRDFAGEMLEKYQDLKLLKYGFSYFRDDPMQDDITWFLLEK
jgi:spore coat polysaccharide biosynthesis protein SpsF